MNNLVEKNSNDITIGDVIDLMNKWGNFFKSNWLNFFICVFIGLGLGILYYHNSEPEYNAKITFVVEDGKNGAGSLSSFANLAGQFGVDLNGNMGGGVFSGDNILYYFKSPSLSRDVLLLPVSNKSKLTFADYYINAYKFKKKWESKLKIENLNFYTLVNKDTFNRTYDSLLNILVNKISIKQFNISKIDKKAGFITVSVTMNNEFLANFYCEQLVNLAVERYLKIKTKRQQLTVEKLQNRADSIKQLLNYKTSRGALLQTLNNTMDVNPLYKSGPSVNSEEVLRDKAMLSSMYSSIIQNLEFAKFTLNQETPVIEIIDKPIKPLPIIKVSILSSVLCSIGLMIIIGIVVFALRPILKSRS